MPIDLSQNLKIQINNKFGNGSHMISSDIYSFAECNEINLEMIAKNKIEANEMERVNLARKQNEEKIQKSMALANREEAS